MQETVKEKIQETFKELRKEVLERGYAFSERIKVLVKGNEFYLASPEEYECLGCPNSPLEDLIHQTKKAGPFLAIEGRMLYILDAQSAAESADAALAEFENQPRESGCAWRFGEVLKQLIELYNPKEVKYISNLSLIKGQKPESKK